MRKWLITVTCAVQAISLHRAQGYRPAPLPASQLVWEDFAGFFSGAPSSTMKSLGKAHDTAGSKPPSHTLHSQESCTSLTGKPCSGKHPGPLTAGYLCRPCCERMVFFPGTAAETESGPADYWQRGCSVPCSQRVGWSLRRGHKLSIGTQDSR